MFLALEYSRSAAAVIATRVLARTVPGLVNSAVTSAATPLRLITKPELRLPGEGWVRLRPSLSGISAADLRLLTTGYGPYAGALMSPPFIPGHEVVGTLDADCADPSTGSGGPLSAGTRVVLDPVLGCAARGVQPCRNCADGRANRCDNLTAGPVGGLRTGFTAETGGGWASELIAHRSQLHAVPDGIDDELALLVQPLARALHLVGQGRITGGEQVLVVGAGLTGLLVCWSLRRLHPSIRPIVIARHPRQRDLAAQFGAEDVLAPTDALRGVRRTTRATRVSGGSRLGLGGRPGAGRLGIAARVGLPVVSRPGSGGRRGMLRPADLVGPDFLLGGVDVAIDAAGTPGSLGIALHSTRAGGRVVVAGSFGERGRTGLASALTDSGPDLTAIWLRELELAGSYAATADDYRRAMEWVPDLPVGVGLVGARYGLRQWRQAIDHALARGKSGTVKVAFELRGDR